MATKDPEKEEDIKLESSTEETSSGLSESSDEVRKAKGEILELKEDIKEFNKKLKEKEARTIEVLAIFVALFSFISVSVQVFNRVSTAEGAGLIILLIFCTLASMIILLDMLLFHKNWSWKKIKKNGKARFFGFFILIACISVFLLSGEHLNPVKGTIEFQESLDEKVTSKIHSEFQNEFYSKKELETKLEKINKKIEDIKNN